MTFHPSSAVSVAIMLIVAAVVVAGYHLGRRPSARGSAPAARSARHKTWVPAAGFLTVLVLVLAALFTAAFNAAT
ncbi:hypothetical protein [Paractinoplanes hotanensis]|uniref:Uncharacterized protein n=1 Tax=Paractinoplanes hotanensis TaxID=2906497 RepID=A0ABT0YCN3_9ACTN|nr:hypothetical protein [Actinoplanes hotanensis]MCM4083237.1 hypothetical protein [Actinoplanes hotanensis]